MFDPKDSLDVQVEKQQKVIAALMNRFERKQDMGGSAFALFQSAVALESQVREKTEDLERALNTIGERNTELQNIYTERKQDQQSLADTLEVMNEGYALIKEGYLMIFNERFRQLFPDISDKIYVGLAAEDLLELCASSEYLDLPNRDARADWKESRLQALHADSSTFVLPLKDDRWYNVTYQRTRFGNLAILQTNVTDLVRKSRAEKNQIIGENTILLQAVFEHLSLAICLVSPDGKIKMCNQRFLEFLKLSPNKIRESVSYKAIIDMVNSNGLIKGSLTAADFEEWAKSLSSGQEIKKRLDMSNGMIIDMKLLALPDQDFIATFDDVTSETKAKIALVEAKERLEERVNERTSALLAANTQLKERALRQAEFEQQLLEAKNAAEAANQSKTRFLAAASHDLLQPINAAKLYISTLEDVAVSKETQSLAGKIATSFESVESLLQSLLEISRLEANGAKFAIREFPLSDILSNLAVDFAPLAAVKGLSFDVVDSSRWVRSDKTYLRRIIFNLVTNAIEYTNGGRVLVGCRLDGEKLRVEVWDTGVGISKKDHDLIFEEFQRLSKSREVKGIGLGLSIVERACNQLGHKLSMRSKPDVGSVFAVEVDIVQPKEVKKDAVGTPIEGNFNMDGVIALVIENDENVLNAMTQKLETWGISVLPAESTEASLKSMREVGLAPDVIIADYQLDDDDNGFKAIEALRKASEREIPAIIVTGNQVLELDLEGERLGVEILRKPVPFRKLRSLIGWKTRSDRSLPAQNESR